MCSPSTSTPIECVEELVDCALSISQIHPNSHWYLADQQHASPIHGPLGRKGWETEALWVKESEIVNFSIYVWWVANSIRWQFRGKLWNIKWETTVTQAAYSSSIMYYVLPLYTQLIHCKSLYITPKQDHTESILMFSMT